MQLLVSVRNSAEAIAALEGGADFIDVKEPNRGALGYAAAETLQQIATAVGDRAPLSAALGEIGDGLPPAGFQALTTYRFAKLGLAGAREMQDWPLRWRSIVEQLPHGVRPVAVVYADGQLCGAPTLAEVLPHAGALHCAGLLVDTFTKDGRSVFDFISSDALDDVVAVARRAGLRSVIAGSVQMHHLPQLAALSPDIVAVRGAVCAGGRAGHVEAQRVAEFRRELARNSQQRAAACASPSQV